MKVSRCKEAGKTPFRSVAKTCPKVPWYSRPRLLAPDSNVARQQLSTAMARGVITYYTIRDLCTGSGECLYLRECAIAPVMYAPLLP